MTTKKDRPQDFKRFEHRFDPDADRCVCGGQILYFEEAGTHGCEAWGPIWKAGRPTDHDLRPVRNDEV